MIRAFEMTRSFFERESDERGEAFVNYLKGLNANGKVVGISRDVDSSGIVFTLTDKGRMEFKEIFNGIHKKMEAVVDCGFGGDAVSNSLLTGLVGVYDSYLGDVIRYILSCRRDLIGTKVEVNVYELSQVGAEGALLDKVIRRRVESILHDGIEEQVKWVEDACKIKNGNELGVRKNFERWSEFVEVFERRHLIVHCSRVVNERYVNRCSGSNCVVGDILPSVDNMYFRRAGALLIEFFLRMSHMVVRLMSDEDRDECDAILNNYVYDFLRSGDDDLALRISKYAVSISSRSSELYRKMFVVNCACAHQSSGYDEESRKILRDEDWSACTDEMKAAVASLMGEFDEVVKYVEKGSLGEEEVRNWPAFRRFRDDDRYKLLYDSVFKEVPIRMTEHELEASGKFSP